MKKIFLLFITLFLLAACGHDKPVPKPEKLFSEKEMENIMFDMALLQAMRSSAPKVLDDNGVDVKNYIYKKYKTDSLTYNQNHTYYASRLDVYEDIQKKVTERLNKAKATQPKPEEKAKEQKK